MDIALWVVTGLLAALYLVVGAVKVLRGPALAERMPWAGAMPGWAVRLIGLVEMAGAAGLVVPQATGEMVWLTPLAATCLAALQLLAIAVHVRRRETQQLAINATLVVLALVLAAGRFTQWDLAAPVA
ncbi:DoxX family protein [Xylanimonas oleitrophica]|uniref:DoxX family protein n=1 Tax=Xylanimonas oleitrophica TaxID=2607479 RepID=A0A2W5Y9V2_9MICO|nr:DoxX family protein [Xylanimonas oleitrophica]PZR55504.1 DoxX family protein [Xylanimonas oleitrophica]